MFAFVSRFVFAFGFEQPLASGSHHRANTNANLDSATNTNPNYPKSALRFPAPAITSCRTARVEATYSARRAAAVSG